MTGNDSSVWDKVYAGFSGDRFSVWKEKPTSFVVEKIPFLKGENVVKILDAGCGDGRNLFALAQEGFDVFGVDSSIEACKRARRVKEMFPNTIVEQLDLKNLQFENEFDAVLCDFVTIHIEDIDSVVANFQKALREKGLLLIEFISKEDESYGKGKKVENDSFVEDGVFHRFYSEEEVKNVLGSFEILEMKSEKHLDPGHGKYHRTEPHFHHSIYVLARKK